jgi:hypothetical protein
MDNLVSAVFGDDIMETGILEHLGSSANRCQNGSPLQKKICPGVTQILLQKYKKTFP